MKKKTIWAIIAVAGLLCSCGQPLSGSQEETQGVEYEPWNVIPDSITSVKRVQKWEDYVEEHPKDEMAWRNLYDAKQSLSYYTKNYISMDEEEGKAFMQRVQRAIPDTYTYYLLAMETCRVSAEIRKYGNEALKRLPEKMIQADYDIWCRFLINDKGGNRLKGMLTRYYESGLMSPEVLYYHYNEMQGMEEGGIYLASWEGEIIPKKMIQEVFGLHRDKILANRNGDWGIIWKQCGVPFPDVNWAETIPMDSCYFDTQTFRMMAWIAEHSQHPVYYSANRLGDHTKKRIPKELLQNLYNEGLLVRYSSKPYDNMAVTCRNVEERYLLDYLYLPFTPIPKPNGTYFSDVTDYAYDTIILLQGILPYYQKHDSQRCHWLSGLLLKAIERWKEGSKDIGYRDVEYWEKRESEIRPYYEETKSVAQ